MRTGSLSMGRVTLHMKLLDHHGIVDFVVCASYRGDVIRDYFLDYEARTNDFTVHLGIRDTIEWHGRHPEADRYASRRGVPSG